MPRISTARSICRIVLIPVERMMGRPVARVWRSRLSSVKDAEATLKQGTSKRLMTSTESVVPTGGEPRHLDLAAIAIDLLVVFEIEFQPALQIARYAKTTLSRLGQNFLAAV